MNRQARRNIAQRKARKAYDEFLELIEQAYGVHKHGYMWEDLKTLDKSSPEYQGEKNKEIDNSIVQASLLDAIIKVGDAAVAMTDFSGALRTKLFKTAIIYYEAVEAWEHAHVMAVLAMKKAPERDYFMDVERRNRGKKNHDHAVVLDLEKLFDQFTEV